MECVFDENEVEYHSCERPMCNHTECDKHEEYQTCEYLGLGKVCKRSTNCRDSGCSQHPDFWTEAASNTATYMKRYVGKRVFACKDGRYSHPGVLIKAFVKGKAVAYKVKENNGNMGTFSDVRPAMYN